MYFDYLNVLVFSAVGLVFVFANLIVASIIRPKRKVTEGLETYECGEEAIGEAWLQFDIRYYTVALVYVIFAVEIAFLFPWAVGFKDLSDVAFWSMMVFLAVLTAGFAYEWKKGALEWE